MCKQTILSLCFLFGLTWKLCESSSPKIKILKYEYCRSAAEFEWMIFEMQDEMSNCSIVYSTTEQFSRGDVNVFAKYPAMKNEGNFRITGLDVGLNYSVQIKCQLASSDVMSFVIEDKDCSWLIVSTAENPVVVFKQPDSLLGMRDSILGIVFGLFGVTIILVATFYIIRKVRRRQRLERIRRYLGSSLIDPFDNMRDTEGSGSERLIEQIETPES